MSSNPSHVVTSKAKQAAVCGCVGLLHCLRPPSPVLRELFSLSDGGQLYLDWCGDSYDERTQADSDPERPTVIILPGITGEGREGALGVHGREGALGLHGREGALGLHGREGALGLHGREGAHGLHGREGALGLNGREGAHGLHGREGALGLHGREGALGVHGREGALGLHGREGASNSSVFQ